MARGRDDRATRHRDDGEYLDERERRHRRRHKSRDHDDEPTASTRERRERRRAEEARRQAEVDIEDIRARRESYYSRNEAEKRRDRDRMASDSKRTPAKEKPRSSREKEVRRDSTRKPKRAVIPDDHDDFVFGRPKSMGHVEEVTVRRSSGRKRSEEGGSSSRTAYTPHSGSGSASVRRVEVPPLTRNSSTREPKAHTSAREREPRPTVRRSNTVKSPPPTPLTRTQSVKDAARRSTGGILSSFFSKAAPPVSRTPSRKAEEKTLVSPSRYPYKANLN